MSQSSTGAFSSRFLALTNGFTSAVVGEGGFRTVYLACLSGVLAVVKIHRSSERLHRIFRQELNALLRVCHPYIICLLAFCDQQEEGVLVLEFAANGNLHEKLYSGGKATRTMPWARRESCLLTAILALRLKAYGAPCDARGLVYGERDALGLRDKQGAGGDEGGEEGGPPTATKSSPPPSPPLSPASASLPPAARRPSTWPTPPPAETSPPRIPMPPPLEARDYIGLGVAPASSSCSCSSFAAREVGPHLALRFRLPGSESPGRAEVAVDATLTLSPAPPRGDAKRGFADSLDRSVNRDAAAAATEGLREEEKGMGEGVVGAPRAAK